MYTIHTMYKIDSGWEHTYCIAQATLLNALWCLNGREVQKGREMCVCVVDSACYTVESNTMLHSNCTAIKFNSLKK